MSTQIGQAYPLIVDKSGNPLDNGIIYIGESGQNPENYPIPIYYDEFFTIPAPQPLRTVNGYFSRNGSPAKIFINAVECSIVVKDKFNILQWSDLNYTSILSGSGIKASDVQDESGLSQQQLNDGLESIAEMLAIANPQNRMTALVKSFSSALKFKGGGKFTFVENDTTPANDVNIFAGNGGNWHRLNWKNPTIYDAGLDGSEIDATVKFQSLVDSTSLLGFSVDLCGEEIKITALDIPSNTKIINGTINVLSSTWQNTYGRAPIMLKNTDRNAVGVDYEVKANYEAIDTIENITFEDVIFKANTLAGLFFKFNYLNFIRCKGYWNQQNLFKFIGGINGTTLVNDTPTSYNLVDPINGRCEYINIHDCYWFGGYTNQDFSSPFRFNGCGKVNISGGINDSPLGWHIDSYNKDFTLTSADYINSNPQVVLDTTSGVAQADMLALYVGQNCYSINVLGGKWRDFGKKGAYIECCSQVVLDGINAEMTIANNVATFADLQPNWKENTNTIWGNVADVTIKNCTSIGTKYGIQTTPFGYVKSLKNINILDSQITTNSNFDAVSLFGVESYTIKDTKCKGNFTLGPNNTNGLVKDSEFYNSSNYALYIFDQVDGEIPEFVNSSFIVDSGSAIYNNGGSGKSGSIVGGKLKSGSGSPLMQLGTASNLVCYDFENGVTQRYQNFSQKINLAAGATTSTVIKSITGVREGWIPNLTIHGIVSLGHDLTITCSAKVDGISFKIKNNGATSVNFTPNMLLKLNSFCDPVFRN